MQFKPNTSSTRSEENFKELCYACRVGDVENADKLVSSGVNLNAVDDFDNSPLFLASLCGHEDVVQLLLRRGAVCDRDRYEGARCIYGALTDRIRNILLRYDISKAVDIKQPFATHLSSMFVDSILDCTDFVFKFYDGTEISVNRFMLASRSAYFARKFKKSWREKRYILLPETTSSLAMYNILKFIYLVPVLHEINHKDYGMMRQFASKLQFENIIEFMDRMQHIVDPSEKSSLINEYQQEFNSIARKQLGLFVQEQIFEKRILLHGEISELNLFEKRVDPPYFDIIIKVESSCGNTFLYLCHKYILLRAEYFKRMLLSSFEESYCKLPIITLPTDNCQVAETILSYLYYDSMDISWDIALDVLLASDFLLTDRLKTMAAVSITQSKEFLSVYPIFDVLYVAWDTGMERLEHYAAKIIAGEIDRYIFDPRLQEAIERSSKRIKIRQDTDTIELVDDIRFYLLQKHDLQDDDLEMFETEQDSEFLEKSGLSCYKKDSELLDQLLVAIGFDI